MSITKKAVIVTRQGSNERYQFGVVQYGFNTDTSRCQNFTKGVVSEQEMLKMLKSNPDFVLNAITKNGKVAGKALSLTRFDESKGFDQCVILAEMRLDNANLIGYVIALQNGQIAKVTKHDMINQCKQVRASGGIPVQNAVFVDDTQEKKAHIRAPKGEQFFIEVYQRKPINKANKPVQRTAEQKKHAYEKIIDLFTKPQLKQLQLGSQNGQDFYAYANPDLTALQMRVLRESQAAGANIRSFNKPEFDVKCMQLLGFESSMGAAVSDYARPDFMIDQLSEVALGYASGLDISQYADPKIPASEMAERRIRLENNFWSVETVPEILAKQ